MQSEMVGCGPLTIMGFGVSPRSSCSWSSIALSDRPRPGSGSLPMLLSVAGIPQELGALAAPVELAPAPMATAFSVPDEDGDD